MSKKILFVSPYVPNLIRVRPYNLIRALSQRGNRVTLYTLWSDEAERQSLEALRPYTEQIVALPLARWRSLWNVLTTLPSTRPLQTMYCWEPALARHMETLLDTHQPAFDVVHIEHLRGAPYGLFLKRLVARRGQKLPVVWDSVDSISMLFRLTMERSKRLVSRSMARFELSRTEPYEAWLLHQFDGVTVTSPLDRQALLDLPALQGAGKRPVEIAVIPNGVDLDYFSPGDQPYEPDTLVLSGKMSYHANVTMALDFVHNILPHIWHQRPQTRLRIVGKDPVREVLALGEDPRIEVTGGVPHLPPYLRQAAVAVAPIAYGAGIQNKVLEAMACGTPVAVTPQAVAALQVEHGRDLLVADHPEGFADAVVSLLQDAGRRQQIGQAGRCYVEKYHNWEGAAARLEDVYARAGQQK